ncbi:hypothetical protein L208DRAFT_147566 [Tricholoma matsutake]|nr:hypothetical protein L208DRAFT_146937 [Tricholoma matsutake 945]KAF8229869.1 hypothetical protein L208DRAFT_147566 [Tricholoma matsutake 945]
MHSPAYEASSNSTSYCSSFLFLCIVLKYNLTRAPPSSQTSCQRFGDQTRVPHCIPDRGWEGGRTQFSQLHLALCPLDQY